MSEIKKTKVIINDKITFVGLICSFIFGLILGGLVYLFIKIANLKNLLWIVLFFFFPPVLGAIIFLLSKSRKVSL